MRSQWKKTDIFIRKSLDDYMSVHLNLTQVRREFKKVIEDKYPRYNPESKRRPTSEEINKRFSVFVESLVRSRDIRVELWKDKRIKP